jgi:membrane-bound lytic murein transglycosylase D
MEEVFFREGLPLQLTRLPFVESSFNVNARSKVGASGIWQFMPSTGSLFLKVGSVLDERNDPIRATEAAAKLLKMNFESLGSWPLAVTAYNHGRKGIQRAVSKLGTLDLNDLVMDYRRRAFGFASSNFYTCLLAAIEVEKNAEAYFGKVDHKRPIPTFEFVLPEAVRLAEVIDLLKLNRLEVSRLNPALDTLEVWQHRGVVPAGYRLRLPLGGETSAEAALRVFTRGYELIPAGLKRGPASLSGSTR